MIPLLFCHRKVGDVFLGMPFIQTTKFSDALPALTLEQCLVYMKNLLRALAYIHSLNIIHRDVKPANFLFDFRANVFRLVDFGLAQASSGADIKPPTPPPPSCKRTLTSRDLGNSGSAASNNASGSSGSPRKRSRANSGRSAGNGLGSPPPSKSPRTPTRSSASAAAAAIKQEHYGSRGSVRRPFNSPQDQKEEEEEEQQKHSEERRSSKRSEDKKTPVKIFNREMEDAAVIGGLRRSPRKHHVRISESFL